MTADTPARVSDADLAAMLRAADNDHFLTKEYTHDACRDLRDARALVQSQAATIAEQRAEIERLKEAVAMLPNKIESEGVTPRPPGASDWWATAVGERRKRKAAESALATARSEGRIAGREDAAKRMDRRGVGSCERGTTDPSTGVFECRRLDQGECNCAEFDEEAEAIRALPAPKEK